MDRHNAPRGIYIFAILFTASSLMHMLTLASSKSWYLALYSYMDPAVVELRYLFSWLQRIAGLTAGIGLLYYKNFSRKLAIVIGWFTIATIYWKHPITAFKEHAQILDSSQTSLQLANILKQTGGAEAYVPSFSELAVLSSIVHSALDITFCALLIYYFTRPEIIDFFTANDQLKERNNEH